MRACGCEVSLRQNPGLGEEEEGRTLTSVRSRCSSPRFLSAHHLCDRVLLMGLSGNLALKC